MKTEPIEIKLENGQGRIWETATGWSWAHPDGSESCEHETFEAAEKDLLEYDAELKNRKSNSIGIQKWANGQEIEKIWETGEGDEKMIGWQRSDGERAIETNGDPCFGGDEFEAVWDEAVKNIEFYE